MRGKRLQIPIIGSAASRTAAVFYDPKISDGVAVSVLSVTGPTRLPTVTSQVSTRPLDAICASAQQRPMVTDRARYN